jgi:hypothetical protein
MAVAFYAFALDLMGAQFSIDGIHQLLQRMNMGSNEMKIIRGLVDNFSLPGVPLPLFGS